jgi:LacI family transcriptional regulator
VKQDGRRGLVAKHEVTIYDVAELAQVSISTVSNVLNRPERVAAATRERVLGVADAVGYVPKADAVSKARQAMHRVGVLAPFTSYRSYLERLAGLLDEARGSGTEVAVFDHESAATASSPVLASMPIRGQMDGLIVMGMRVEEAIERRLLERRVPTVVVDADSERFPVVTCDDRVGGELVGKYLLGLGHRRFGYVVERQNTPYASQALLRLDGFRATVEKRRGTALEVVEAGNTPISARDAAIKLLSSPVPPTAVMAHCDDLAVGVLAAASDLSLSVPEQLSVVGCDDGPGAEAAGLTTVHQPLRESGSVALRSLLAMINGAGFERSVTYLPLKLVERSTACPAVPRVQRRRPPAR